MSQLIEVPGYGQVEFPDGMADKDIELAIRKNMLRKDAPTWQERFVASPLARFAVGAASPVAGVAQLAAEPVSRTLGTQNPVTERLQRLQEMQQAGGHEGADLAGLAGAVVAPMGPLSKIPMAASAAGRIAQGAGLGAAFGMAQPVTEGDVLARKPEQAMAGAIIGGAIPAVGAGVGKVASAARNIVDPWLPGGADRVAARIANQAAGARRPEVLAALRANQQLVPGSQPTAGEAAATAGSAEFSGLQKITESLRPSEYAARTRAQDAARSGAVRSFGQDRAALEAAEAARASNAAANYSQAYQQAVKADPELALIASNPFFKEALPDALRLAQAEGINPKTDTTRFLHLIKLSLDKRLEANATNALGGTERKAVARIKDRLVEWISRKNPAYDQARQQFAQDSVPINQMQVGQALEQKLTSPVEGAAQRVHQYSEALRNPTTLLKQSTHFKGNEQLSDVLTPPQVNTATGVAKDLARAAEHDRLASAGRQRAQDIVSEVLPAAPAAGMFNPKYSVARAIVNRLTGNASSKALDALAVRMQDPVQMAQLMEQLNPVQRKMVLEELMRAAGIAGSVTAAQ
jgi:hypothetical protein